MLRHRKGFTAYVRQDRANRSRHIPSLSVVDGAAVCGLCSYPLGGKFYRVTVAVGHMDVLLNELRGWRVDPERYRREGDSIITADNNVIDVVTETFRRRDLLYDIKELSVA